MRGHLHLGLTPFLTLVPEGRSLLSPEPGYSLSNFPRYQSPLLTVCARRTQQVYRFPEELYRAIELPPTFPCSNQDRQMKIDLSPLDQVIRELSVKSCCNLQFSIKHFISFQNMKFTFPKASSCKKLLFCFSAVRNSPAAVACFSTTSKTDPTDQKVGLNQTQLQSKNDFSTDYSSNEVLRHQRYSFRKLAQKDKQAAVYLLSQAFAEQEPLTNAYFKLINRDIQSQKLKLFTSFWNTFIDDSVDNQMSVATFDLQKNGELIGISVAKDLNYVPQGFEQKYMKGLNFISPAIALQEILISHTKPQNQNILKEKGVVMDIWGVALKKEHTGKKLLNKMVLGNETLGIKQGFKYGFSYASNFKTGIALSKQKYAKISEIDCKEFEFLGVKPFELIQQTQRRPSLWLKKLE